MLFVLYETLKMGPQSIFRTVSHVCSHCEAVRKYLLLTFSRLGPFGPFTWWPGRWWESSYPHQIPLRLQDLHWRCLGSSGRRNPTRLSVHHLPRNSRRGLRSFLCLCVVKGKWWNDIHLQLFEDRKELASSVLQDRHFHGQHLCLENMGMGMRS